MSLDRTFAISILQKRADTMVKGLRSVKGMTEIDQFESVFKSAGKTLFQHEEVSIEKVLVVCDGDQAATEKLHAVS